MVTDIHMSAQGCGTTALDVCHGFELLPVQRMCVAVILPVIAEDICYLKARAYRGYNRREKTMRLHGGSGCRRVSFKAEGLKRAFDLSYKLCTHMGVSGCGPDGAMAEQGLNQSDVGVCFGQVGRT